MKCAEIFLLLALFELFQLLYEIDWYMLGFILLLEYRLSVLVKFMAEAD